MLVTDLPSIVAGMISAPDAFLSQSVIVTAPPSVSYFKWGLTGASSVGLVSATGSSGSTSCCFSSTGLTSSLGVVGFSPTDSEPSDDDFSPQPATSSAANSSRAFFIPDTYLPQAQSASGERLATRIWAG